MNIDSISPAWTVRRRSGPTGSMPSLEAAGRPVKPPRRHAAVTLLRQTQAARWTKEFDRSDKPGQIPISEDQTMANIRDISFATSSLNLQLPGEPWRACFDDNPAR